MKLISLAVLVSALVSPSAPVFEKYGPPVHAVWQATPPPATVDEKPIATIPSAQKPAQKAPELTPLEKAQIEIFSLKQQLALTTAQLQVCQANAAPTTYQSTLTAIGQEIAEMITAYEKAHPGWTRDPKTLQPVKKGG